MPYFHKIAVLYTSMHKTHAGISPIAPVPHNHSYRQTLFISVKKIPKNIQPTQPTIYSYVNKILYSRAGHGKKEKKRKNTKTVYHTPVGQHALIRTLI
jgi:hypothetical protein